MNEIFEANINLLASTTTIAVMLTSGPDAGDNLTQAVSDVVLVNVIRQFAEKDGVKFDIQKHEIPTDYCIEALQHVLTIAKVAALLAGIGRQ